MKLKCRKWPCMSHSDICSTSYVRKKGQESNWQFDSRPIKAENRPDPGVCKWNATHRWKVLNESNKFSLNLILIGSLSKELCQNSGSPNRDNFGTPPWESREKVPFECKCDGVMQRIIYGGRWWLPPRPGRGESWESKVARGLS